ncbi:hypothetical protein BDK51DRAFT_52821 [Blyttiomyces helicus]|uniref:Uncharacterized protein n=1 Tax=Blyttiomyces helicus TaxID=388810 RepID=A0A4P9W2L1_9FUNG|nr:hypothetical protein BDK51DRAFT_52821 [Blyttiomyces helicus]|eukprot:RKO85038.1 hypothetical protein BDK51DRAFT_52821 [Blyttiomyces helicus]
MSDPNPPKIVDSTVNEDDDDLFPTDMFQEPEGFRPVTPPPTTEEYVRDEEDIWPGMGGGER